MRSRRDIPEVRQGDAPRRYRRSMDTNPEHAEHYRAEGERRHAQGELGAAIRAVSSLSFIHLPEPTGQSETPHVGFCSEKYTYSIRLYTIR